MAWNKPLPHPTEISAPYWEGLKAHEVRIQQCDRGHSLFFRGPIAPLADRAP
jgi:hypothetical protein